MKNDIVFSRKYFNMIFQIILLQSLNPNLNLISKMLWKE